MKKLAALVDPSNDCDEMVDYINKNWGKIIIDVWVGCSVDSGVKTQELLQKLQIPTQHKILFPGRLFQGIRGGKDVGYILKPNILGNHPSKRRFLCNAISRLGGYVVDNAFSGEDTKMLDFGYIVINGENSSVGKRVGAKEITDAEAILLAKEYMQKTDNCFGFIYVEGGSGSIESIAERTNLLKELKDKMDNKKLYAGGGINNIEQFKKVVDIVDCVVVGTAFEKNPKLIGEFYKLIY